MKKLKLFVMSLCAMFVAVLGVSADALDSCEDPQAVAQVGDKCYAKLSEAFKEATAGQTVTLKTDIDIVAKEDNGYVSITNAVDLTFDLNGHELTSNKSSYAVLYVNTGKSLTITDTSSDKAGKIKHTDPNRGSALNSQSSSTVTLKGGTFTNSDTSTDGAVQVGSQTTKGTLIIEDGARIEGGGVVIADGSLVMNGGVIETKGFTISGNGSATKNSDIKIKGGKLISNDNAAIYNPQNGTLDITGGDITGKLGIVARSGKVTIGGDVKITTTGETSKTYRVGDAQGDGGYVMLEGGTGVVLDNSESYPGGQGTITITGGEFNTTGASVLDYKNEEEKNIKVSGGTFNKEVPEEYFASTDLGQSENGVVGKVSTITVDKAEHANVVKPANAAEGEKVTITVTPDEGYVIKEVLVNGTAVTKNADGTYSFVMPNKEVTITVNTEVEQKEVVVEEQAAGDKEVTLSKETDEVLKDSLANTEDEELKELLKNNDVTVELKATKVEKESLEKEEVAKFESVVKGANVTEFFDLSILVEAAGEEVHYLKELSKPITLTIDLPELPEVAKGYERKYYIIREHNGVYEKLNATLEDGKLSFATDKFSTYALAYIDEKVKNPNTVDNIVSVVATGLVSLVVIAGGIVLVRKNKFNN